MGATQYDVELTFLCWSALRVIRCPTVMYRCVATGYRSVRTLSVLKHGGIRWENMWFFRFLFPFWKKLSPLETVFLLITNSTQILQCYLSRVKGKCWEQYVTFEVSVSVPNKVVAAWDGLFHLPWTSLKSFNAVFGPWTSGLARDRERRSLFYLQSPKVSVKEKDSSCNDK